MANKCSLICPRRRTMRRAGRLLLLREFVWNRTMI